MGIRCRCPNGHILNLKSFLAGKRGICPQCQAKFVIPRESVPDDTDAARAVDPMVESVSIQTATDRTPDAETVGAANQSASSGGAVTTAPRTETAALADVQQTAPAARRATTATRAGDDPAEATAWYVRLESGEKFGPADSKTLQAWADEGRVPPSALLWHEGWDDWHKAETVLSGPAIVPAAVDTDSQDQASSNQASAKGSASSWAEHNFPLHNDEPHVQTEGRHDTVTLRHRRRRGESRKITATAILLLLLVVMVPVLLLVVFR